MNKNGKNEITIRSSAAEYLTYITATGEGGVDAVYFDENVWLTQKMMGVLYDVETHTINYHLKKLFNDGEIDEATVIRNFRITANDGKTYNTKHYNLKAIIAVGHKVDSPRAVQFRKWANDIIEEYTIKAYAMDDERIKNGGNAVIEEYEKIYYEANSFLQATKMLCSDENKLYGWFNPVLYPTIVNISFSCELFVKCLLVKNKTPIKGHNLKELFDKLDSAQKQQIKKLTKEIDFDILLENHSDYFVKFRYVYGENNKMSNVNLSFMFAFANSLKDVIKEVL